MSDLKTMKSLNEIAFENVYHLLLHYVSAVSTYVGRAKTVKTVRELLDEYLIGPKYSPMREKMIAKYSQNHNFQWEELYLVLDCVLDESSVKFAEYFTSHFHAPPPHHAVSLINTVVKRCPLLQELSLTIAHYRPILTLQHESLIAKSFSQLGNLTKLELNWSRQSSLPSSDYIPFYSLIGNSCPKLVQLKLGQHFPFGNDQALALVLGEKVHLLPESMKQQMRQTVLRVKIDDKYITPMCKSLQHLEAHFTQSTASSDAICLLTFVLHHLPKLEILDLNSCMDYYEDFDHFVALAVSNLHKPSDCTSRPPQTTVIPSECLGWTVNAPPPKSLNLRMLDSSVRQYVDVCSSNQLNAVASLCPRLKTVSFKDRYIERGDIELSPQQVASLFDNQFQQVEEIFFHYVTSDYCRAILESIGKQLIKLEFYHCEDMDLGCLLPCTNLEVLTIGKLCTVDASVAVQDPPISLPHLKKLTIDSRLSELSLLLSNRDSNVTL